MIGCFKFFLHCIVISCMEPWAKFLWLVENPMCLLRGVVACCPESILSILVFVTGFAITLPWIFLHSLTLLCTHYTHSPVLHLTLIYFLPFFWTHPYFTEHSIDLTLHWPVKLCTSPAILFSLTSVILTFPKFFWIPYTPFTLLFFPNIPVLLRFHSN